MLLASTRSLKSTMATAVLLTLACGPGAGEDAEGGSSTTEDASAGGSIGAPSSTSGNSATSGLDGVTESTDDATETSTTEPSCDLPPVDPRIVDRLRIFSASPYFWLAPAGGSMQLFLGYFGDTIPETIIPVHQACVEWSVEPVDGVTLDATGTLSVDASVPVDTTFTVTADLEDGRSIMMMDLRVYQPVFTEFLGSWTEVQQLPCDGGEPYMPDPAIAELVFYDNSEFTVSWTGFEKIIDYWGTFTYDEDTNALVLAVDDNADNAPDDIDGEGTASVVDGQLVLEDMWLGTWGKPTTPVACGHVFEELHE